MTEAEGSIRPALYLAEGLVEKGYEISIISPQISSDVEKYLSSRGIKPINLHAKFFAKNFGSSILWLETWVREAFFKLNSRLVNNKFKKTRLPRNIINFSQVISVPSLAWYLQGPPSAALKDMEKELSTSFKVVYNFSKNVVERADEDLINRISGITSRFIANSKFCASLYSTYGVKVHDVIYPPLDCQIFRPSTSKPSSNYVLTYFGKETEFSTLKRVADSGVKIKAFGSKAPFIRKELTKHLNIEFLGRVSTKELVDLYSNALFTLFPFNHEPFGYIPLESMACGTPVLTYKRQGPSEYVVDNSTGWLAETKEEFVRRAVELWDKGYPSHMRTKCVAEAFKFDRKFYLQKWLKCIAF